MLNQKNVHSAKKQTLIAFGAFISFFGPLALDADEIIFQQEYAPDGTYTGSSSAWIRDDQLSSNDNGDRLLLGTTGSAQLNGLLSFDVSSIPTGATIDSVSLSLFYQGDGGNTQSGTYTLNVHALTRPHVENEATWSEASTGNSWTTPGGDYNSEMILASVSDDPSQGTKFDELIFASTSDFTNIVQTAINGNGAVDMLIKLADADLSGSTRKVFDFFSDDNNVAGITSRPELTVTFTVPESSSSALLLGIGIVGFVSTVRRRRS